MYGQVLTCSTIRRFALSVPVSVPTSVVAESAALTGFGVAASETPSGWRRVVNERRSPSVVPEALRATYR